MNSASETLVKVIEFISNFYYLEMIMTDIVLYTIADVVIVFGTLKIATFLLDKVTRSIFVCYMLLSLTVIMIPGFFILKGSAYKFTLLSAIISGLHYLIILYSIFSVRKEIIHFFHKLEKYVA